MKLLTPLCLLSACLAPATALNFFGGEATAAISDAGSKIPGDSPLEYCGGDHSNDLVVVEKVDLDPNPPKAGQKLVIKATGFVNQTIENGAYVKLTVKYGLIKLLTTTADLCEQFGNVDMKCPIEKGNQTVEKTVQLPVEIPPGTYNVVADAFNADDTHLTCLTATVSFKMGGFGSEL